MTITKRGNAASGWALDFAYELAATNCGNPEPAPDGPPRQPHQNFDDFSKSLENSKNFPYYEEHLNHHE